MNRDKSKVDLKRDLLWTVAAQVLSDPPLRSAVLMEMEGLSANRFLSRFIGQVAAKPEIDRLFQELADICIAERNWVGALEIVGHLLIGASFENRQDIVDSYFDLVSDSGIEILLNNHDTYLRSRIERHKLEQAVPYSPKLAVRARL